MKLCATKHVERHWWGLADHPAKKDTVETLLTPRLLRFVQGEWKRQLKRLVSPLAEKRIWLADWMNVRRELWDSSGTSLGCYGRWIQSSQPPALLQEYYKAGETNQTNQTNLTNPWGGAAFSLLVGDLKHKEYPLRHAGSRSQPWTLKPKVCRLESF